MPTIFHIDADAFFASCEQSTHPDWIGRAVVTGAERGIVSAASYEAKNKGVSRKTPLWDVHKIIPSAIIVSSDYQTYTTFSKRMFDIVRRFTPEVEEYSIDEAFVDVTGCDRLYDCSYKELALRMQALVARELGISVSIGIAPTKVLAKIGSKWEKPNGVTEVTTENAHQYLDTLDIQTVWGIGYRHATRFRLAGIRTAGQFASIDESAMEHSMYKPLKEIWHELNGTAINSVHRMTKQEYKSISKVKTFTPPSSDTAYLKTQLMRNLEESCNKARRYGLIARGVGLYMREADFHSVYRERTLPLPSVYPSQIFAFVESMFNEVYDPEISYRSTGVTLLGLQSTEHTQKPLFQDYDANPQLGALYSTVDRINRKYGKETIGTVRALRKKTTQVAVPPRLTLPLLHITV